MVLVLIRISRVLLLIFLIYSLLQLSENVEFFLFGVLMTFLCQFCFVNILLRGGRLNAVERRRWIILLTFD